MAWSVPVEVVVQSTITCRAVPVLGDSSSNNNNSNKDQSCVLIWIPGMCFVVAAVGWLNEELKGGTQDCRIGLVDPPCPPRDRTGGGVRQLTRGYMTEVLHNIYCLRVFDWEQVCSACSMTV